mmetsp:Transcript_99289/g.276447  ORF Transcript_99289/g.276447 Transcript_99289/m.276447 type:complete len:267 (-) Transcript_99289:487-1287(-)
MRQSYQPTWPWMSKSPWSCRQAPRAGNTTRCNLAVLGQVSTQGGGQGRRRAPSHCGRLHNPISSHRLTRIQRVRPPRRPAQGSLPGACQREALARGCPPAGGNVRCPRSGWLTRSKRSRGPGRPKWGSSRSSALPGPRPSHPRCAGRQPRRRRRASGSCGRPHREARRPPAAARARPNLRTGQSRPLPRPAPQPTHRRPPEAPILPKEQRAVRAPPRRLRPPHQPGQAAPQALRPAATPPWWWLQALQSDELIGHKANRLRRGGLV